MIILSSYLLMLMCSSIHPNRNVNHFANYLDMIDFVTCNYSRRWSLWAMILTIDKHTPSSWTTWYINVQAIYKRIGADNARARTVRWNLDRTSDYYANSRVTRSSVTPFRD